MFDSRNRKNGFRFFPSTDEETISEVRTIELVCSGDSTAFEIIFKSYYPRLCQFAYRSVKSAEVAEDLVQSVFMKIWNNRRDWKPQCTLRQYLYKATRNQVINYLKHKKIENIADFVDISMIQKELMTPESRYLENECSSAIQKTINRLPPRCRLIFLMKKEDGLKYKEIADILEISIKTVETQIHRALQFLRKNLAEYS